MTNKNNRTKTISGHDGKIFSIIASYDEKSIVKDFYIINIDNSISILPKNDYIFSTIVFLNIYSTIGLEPTNPVLGSIGILKNYVLNQEVGKFYIDQSTLRIQLINYSFTFQDQIYTLRNPTSFTVGITKSNVCDQTNEYSQTAEIISEIDSVVYYDNIGWFRLYTTNLVGKIIPFSRQVIDEKTANLIVIPESSFTINTVIII